MTEEIHKMTTIIEFKRQLWPQPPKDAKPAFYLTNTLGFGSKGKKVWEQEIPEFDLFRTEVNYNKDGEFSYFDLDKIGYYHKVEYDETWGWMILFRISHEDSKAVWDKIFYLLKEELTVANQYPSRIIGEQPT